MGNADATVDRESCRQILIEAVEPRPIHLIHQLSDADDFWKTKDLKRKGVRRRGRWNN